MRIVELKAENTIAKINISRGANCICLKNTKNNISVLREPNYEAELDNPYVYGMPMLFPANRISNGHFTFEGREYSFPINEESTNCHVHGYLHQLDFEVTEKTDCFVKCRYESDEAYSFFPNKFAVEISYTLSENKLLQQTDIINLSDEDMPSLLGYHTTFNIPFIKDSKAENIKIYAAVDQEIARDERFLPNGDIIEDDSVIKEFNNGEFCKKKISKHYKGNGDIILTDIENNVSVIYRNDEKFEYRLFYCEDKDFICLEPQVCMVDSMNNSFIGNNKKCDIIQKKSKISYVSKLEIRCKND